MVYYPQKFVPQLPEIPDNVPICNFMLHEQYGRHPIANSLDPFTCGISGKSFSAQGQKERVIHLARSLSKELGWQVNEGSEFDKVAGIFAQNTIDIMSLSWAVHRLNGVSSPANAAYSTEELQHQLKTSGASCLFTTMSLLQVSLPAAAAAGIPRNRIFICDMAGDDNSHPEFKRLSQLVEAGKFLLELDPIRWSTGQGKRQTAFLCYSSGTSGLPKGVMISHYNVISNVVQNYLFDNGWRTKISPTYHDVALGLLPQSHIYGLIVISHTSVYRGDQVIVLPGFNLQVFLSSIAKYKITNLYIVPPIIVAMLHNISILKNHDLSSVMTVFTGAAPLGKETADDLGKQFPGWKIRQAYGLTESATTALSTHPDDIVFGSSGCLVSGYEAKVMSHDGKEITEYDNPGELLLKSPSIVLGYLKNEKATAETFVDMPEGRFLRTGDEVVVRKSPKTGYEHIWIVDRIKELIKTKGHQVAPAELEACLLTHPFVADCAVIPIPDNFAGELPKAYVVKSPNLGTDLGDEEVKEKILKHVEGKVTRYKWLGGGVEFIDVIPKSPSGKILRRLLRDKEKDRSRAEGSRL